MKKNKRRKKPPGAKKREVTESNFAKNSSHIKELIRIHHTASDFLANSETIKELDDVARKTLSNSEFDRTIGRLFFISNRLLAGYMTQEWVDKYILGEKEKTFKRFHQPVELEDYKFLARVISFAEMIYNFQFSEGIKEKTQQLTQDGDVESALAELEGTQLLFASGKKVRFIIPSNTKGNDYDTETYLNDGTPVACEMKCKFEKTSFSQKTVEETIKEASRQLPKNIPSLVFIKVPEQWTISEDFEIILSSSAQKAFERTKTVAVVVFHWEVWKPLNPKGALQSFNYKVEANSQARIQNDELKFLIAPPRVYYKRFYEIIGIDEKIIRFEP